MLLACLIGLLAQPAPGGADPGRAVRESLEKTAAAGYAFAVRGRYDRLGEFTPRGLLTSRIRQYQSVRRGDTVLVKGPEGLWKTPGERLGEETEKTDPEAPAIVRVLQEATPPHEMVGDLLARAERVQGPEDREIDGVLCRRYLATLPAGVLKDRIERQLSREIRGGRLRPPDEILWGTARGAVRIYADRRDGRLIRVVDESSVRILYRVPDRPPETKPFKVEMEFEFSPLDPARLSVPGEVLERLGLRED